MNNILFARYEQIAAREVQDPYAAHPRLSLGNPIWMCREARMTQEPFPEDKASRWLGFVQGCLAMRGLIDVDEERELTRPLFGEAAKKAGINPGPTRERHVPNCKKGRTK